MADIIERYLKAIASHDWAVVDAAIADDIIRVGPYGDRYAGRDEYMAFIAELSETTELDGTPMVTSEVLVFALDGDRRIARVEIFIQTPRPATR